MRIVQVVAIAIYLCGEPLISSAADKFEPEDNVYLVDTSVPFAPGAREHFIRVQGPYGLPTFQQGFVEGIHFRIDPDGAALFSRDPRLRNDVFEVDCERVGESCVAKRSIIQLSIGKNGLPIVAFENAVVFDEVYLGYDQFKIDEQADNWKKVNVPLDKVSVELLAGYSQLAILKDGVLVRQVSLDGLLVVRSYLKWVAKGQPTKVLPLSWEDAHDQSSAHEIAQYASLGGNSMFSTLSDNSEVIYSPLLQFETEEQDKTAVVDYGNPDLELAPELIVSRTEQDSKYYLDQPDLVGTVDEKYIASVFRRAETGLTINLQNLTPDQLSSLQDQLVALFDDPEPEIKIDKVSDNSGEDLNTYVAKLNGDIQSELSATNDKLITELMKEIFRPALELSLNNQKVQSGELTTNSASTEAKVSDLEMSFSKKASAADIGGNICKPAILASVEENVIIKKSIEQKHSHSKNGVSANFSDPSEALIGLPGVYVFTDYLAEPAHLKGKFNGRVHDEIEARLRAGGIRVLTKYELETTPGQPRMEVYFSRANVETGCSFAVWISVRQSMLLGRDRKVLLLSGTWGSGGAHLRQYGDAPEFNTILHHVDQFIVDYKKANS